ncbi:MAG: hypothetical protein U9Q05_10890 [Thermodesulfobacteriota bacterium]|nr:hypothetical protein [Thermodesulfobacteriota bacterium]
MRLKIKKNFSTSIFVVLIFLFIISQDALADSKWERLLEQGKLKEGVAVAVTTNIPVDEISNKAVELKYPACDILEAELKAKIDAYMALKTIIASGGDVEHLARCCAEPKIAIASAVFAKAAIDAGLDSDTVDRLIGTAYTPQPGEPGVFTREAIVAGGEIREGIVSPIRP